MVIVLHFSGDYVLSFFDKKENRKLFFRDLSELNLTLADDIRGAYKFHVVDNACMIKEEVLNLFDIDLKIEKL